MILTKQWLTENYKYFNKNIFSDKCPINMALEITNASRIQGCFHFFYDTKYGQAIRISKHYNKTEKHYREILLHEMIHAYIFNNDISDTFPHGKVFQDMMNSINKKYNLNISVTDEVSQEEMDSSNLRDKALLVNFGKNNCWVLKPSEKKFESMKQKVLELSPINLYEIITSDKMVNMLPKCRKTLRGRRINQNTMEEIIKTSKSNKILI